MCLFFALGFMTSMQTISYPVIAELNSPLVTASATSIISMSIVAITFVFQPFFGWLLDLHWDHTTINHIALYSKPDFREALLILPMGFIVSLIAAVLIKETHCKPAYHYETKTD